jgi:hypothetical protein
MRADRFANLQAIVIRQHDVQKNQIRLLTAAEFSGAAPSLGAYDEEPFLGQVVVEESKQIGVVFNNGYFFAHAFFMTNVAGGLLQLCY